MTQRQLNQSVSRHTGESIATIRRMGFSMAEPLPRDDYDDLPRPQVVDWDRLDAGRPAFLPQRTREKRNAA
jgi:hypothetical protein